MADSNSKTFTWIDKAFVWLTTFLKHFITPVNMWLLKISNGRLGNSFLGTPVLLLYTVGCKSGLARVTPLFYFQHHEKIILVASNGGNVKNPAWKNNIDADPETKVKIKGKEMNMRAHIADAEEHRRCWPMAAEFFPTWQTAQDKSSRKFPIVVLERREVD